MRRSRSLLAVPLLVLLLAAGCGDDGDDGGGGGDAADSASPSEEASPSESAGPAYGEKITIDVSTTMTVQEPQPGASGRLDVLVAARNTGFSDSSLDLFLACAGNYNTGSVILDGSTPSPPLTSGTVPADGSVEGYVSLDLPTVDGEVVDSCTPDTVILVVPGFAGQDVTYPIPSDLAEGLLAGS